MRTGVSFLLAMIVWVLPLDLVAQNGEIRRITQTTATSDCIGDNTDPVCTLETLLACRARQMDRWCKLAGWRKGPYGAHTAEYRIFSVEKFIDRAYPFMPDNQSYTYPESVEVGVDVRFCSPGLVFCPNTVWQRIYYLIGLHEGHWGIFGSAPRPEPIR